MKENSRLPAAEEKNNDTAGQPNKTKISYIFVPHHTHATRTKRTDPDELTHPLTHPPSHPPRATQPTAVPRPERISYCAVKTGRSSCLWQSCLCSICAILARRHLNEERPPRSIASGIRKNDRRPQHAPTTTATATPARR